MAQNRENQQAIPQEMLNNTNNLQSGQQIPPNMMNQPNPSVQQKAQPNSFLPNYSNLTPEQQMQLHAQIQAYNKTNQNRMLPAANRNQLLAQKVQHSVFNFNFE